MKKIQEDTEIIQNILKGNSQAQEMLYEKYYKLVKDFLNNKYPTYYDLDDDVSEIMIKVFTGLEKYNINKSKFMSWVFSIAKNHMIDKWRSNTHYTYSTTMADIGSSFINSHITNCISADYDFENCNLISYISGQLTSQDYTLLDMKYVQGYNYAEIGSEFNVTSTTISNRVNYIKTKLKKNNPEIIYE